MTQLEASGIEVAELHVQQGDARGCVSGADGEALPSSVRLNPDAGECTLTIRMDALLHQLAISLRLHARNKMALLYSYLFPTIFLVAFWVLYRFEQVPLVRHMGELLTVTALGGACFGLPTTMVSERERGVWRRYRLTPVSTAHARRRHRRRPLSPARRRGLAAARAGDGARHAAAAASVRARSWRSRAWRSRSSGSAS